MNTVQSDKINYNCFKKTNALIKDKKLNILLFSENQYFTGFFQGYCHVTGCKIKILPSCNYDNFFENLIKESPSVLIIDITQAERLFNSEYWTAAWLFIKQNKIAVYGIGKKSPRNDEALPPSIFNKIFTEPLNINEIQYFLEDIFSANKIR